MTPEEKLKVLQISSATVKDGGICLTALFSDGSIRTKYAGDNEWRIEALPDTRHPNLSAVVKRAVELGQEEIEYYEGDTVSGYMDYRFRTPDEILSIINKEFGV